MGSILALAEAEAQSDSCRGVGGQVTLMRLLKAYEVVLRQHAMAPEEDTHYYRFLLKLSLDPYPDWWDKLEVYVCPSAAPHRHCSR